MGIEEGKETESKDTGNNFNKIIKKIFPNWKNELPVMVQKHTEHQIDQMIKNCYKYIIINTIKERILNAVIEKLQVYNDNSL